MKISKISYINRDRLNDELYFQSLVNEGYKLKLISEIKVEEIKINTFRILKEKVSSFTGGNSSSVPSEVAENILKSVLFTIGIELKSFINPDDALKEIIEKDLLKVYNHGREKLELMIKDAKRNYRNLLINKLDSENITYNETINYGIQGFFKLYNPEYSAHEIHITADYPVINNIDNLLGIEFISKYIKSIYLENKFCNYFNTSDIHYLLLGYEKEYKNLIINIFEIVITNALGCVLLKKNPMRLNINGRENELLYKSLLKDSKEEVNSKVLSSWKELISILKIEDKDLIFYVEKAIPYIADNIYVSVKNKTLNKRFIEFSNYENEEICFDFGEKIDNEKYAAIVSEIIDCRCIIDKVKLFKSEFKSLGDYEEAIMDSELTLEEAFAVFKELDSIHIAALAKKYEIFTGIDLLYLSYKEEKFVNYLRSYIKLMTDNEEVYSIYNKIKINY
ncbi:MAG: hypothetical protein GX275_11485 [Clostridiales bacterium]|nr:hypothetical protein [Clostridiales bacterium]